MKDKWMKVGRAVGGTVTEITYENEDFLGVKIVSCKQKTKNNSPRGFWECTHFFVRRGTESKEFWRLSDAKEYVEKEYGKR